MVASKPSAFVPGQPFTRDVEFLSRATRRARLLASRRIPVVLDVGAWEGEYALSLRDAGFDGRIISFEPTASTFATLQQRAADDPQWDVHQLALGSEPGTATLNIAHDSQCNSLLDVEPRGVQAAPESAFTGTETVRLDRLDKLWNRAVRHDVQTYLKLDVQGYEHQVLTGLGSYLSNVNLIEAELSLVPIYDQAPLWTNLVHYLDLRGFRIASLENIFEDPATGEMLQVDGIFVRR